jgi:peroxiredoxin
MPELQAFFDKYAAQGFVVIGIEDGESPNEVADFVGNYGLTFPIWTDSKYQTEKAFKTMNLPSSYVIDRKGTVQLAWTGGIKLDVLEKYVAPIINQ